MFSRKERDFLTVLAQAGVGRASAGWEMQQAFPNPTYRRKLMWGIRRKVEESVSDLELFAEAASVEARVLPGVPSGPAAPYAADPLVVLIRRIQKLLRTRRGPPPPGEALAGTTGAGRRVR